MTGAGHASTVRVALCSPGEIWGGVEQLVESLARVLMQSGVAVTGIVFNDGMLRERLERANVPVTVIGNGNRYDPRTILRLGACIAGQQINVIHTHGYKAAVLGGIAARLAGIRHVRTEHGRVEPWKGAARLKMRCERHSRASGNPQPDRCTCLRVTRHPGAFQRRTTFGDAGSHHQRSGSTAANAIAGEHRLPAVPASKSASSAESRRSRDTAICSKP